VIRGLALPLGALLSTCAAPLPEPPPLPSHPIEIPAPVATATASAAPPRDPPLACSSDADCGFEPDLDRCTADPRANRQPPLVDQGLVCYCDDASRRCATLRVPPVPCESDASCAVDLAPRPHPIAASREHPHERGRPCRDFAFSTTCERTNICTMTRHRCPAGPRP
jgi:hypothetical protein